MHCHTHHSTDAVASVRSILNKASRLGIGIAITDHNTIAGAQEALALTNGDIVVIPGIEVTSRERKDLLFYFYSPEDMVDFYERHIRNSRVAGVRSRTTLGLEELIRAARQYTVFVGAPHPFGLAYKNLHRYLQKKKEIGLVELLDGIEGINANLSQNSNRKALELASSMKKPIFGGSDAHSTAGVGHTLTCSKAATYQEFLDNVAAGDCFVMGRKLGVYPSLSEWAPRTRRLTDYFIRGIGIGRRKPK